MIARDAGKIQMKISKLILIAAASIGLLSLAGVHAARAQQTPPPTFWDLFKNGLSIISDLPSKLDFNTFSQQVFDTLPILEGLGFEVVLFKVQWGIPPISKLVLRSKGLMDEAQLEAFKARATGGGMLTKVLVDRAVSAKEFQSKMNFGTVILDIDFSLTPIVKTCFLKEIIARDADAYYMGC